MSSAGPDLIPHFGHCDPDKLPEYDPTPAPHLSDAERTSDHGCKLSQRRQTIGGSTKNGRNTTARVRTDRKQEIQHDFRYLSTIGFTTLVMGTWEVFLTTNTASLQNGGVPGLFWSMICSHVGQLFIVLSLAEMASMAPSPGGQYNWVYQFAPQRYRDVLSYCSGWLCSIGWQARFSALCYVIAGLILAMAQLNDETFHGTIWQRGLLTIATAVFVSAFNAFAAGHISIAEGFFALCHVFAIVPIVVSLWILVPKLPPRHVFVDFTDHKGGWSTICLSTLVGQSSAIFVALGSDAVTHIAEEIDNAELLVPQTMLRSFWINLPITLIMLITYVFNIGRVDDILRESVPPFVSVLGNAFQNTKATTGFSVVILCLLVMVATSTMVATSRHLYAFGRDRALFFSSGLSRVDPTLKVPLNAILCTTSFTTVVTIVTISSQTALRTMISLCIVCLMATYMTCIGCLILQRLHHAQLPVAKWSLGRAGIYINGVAFVYATWAFFWSFWPSFYHVTGANFVWASVLFAFVLALALIIFAAGRRRQSLARARSMRAGSQGLLPIPR